MKKLVLLAMLIACVISVAMPALAGGFMHGVGYEDPAPPPPK